MFSVSCVGSAEREDKKLKRKMNCSREDEDQQSTRERRYELRVGTSVCPSCGHGSQPSMHDSHEEAEEEKVISLHDLPGLPAGVKFDPTDQELLEHLDGKVKGDVAKLHPLLHEFIPLIPGEEGICYTHPEKLPGVSMGGHARHFFHYPSKAYTTGTRKRRKVQTDEDGSETRWHKTGKTRPIFVGGKTKGHKKILVLYTNYGRLKKPQKTNWVMHQYHLGSQDEEREGELVVSKVFYQTQPRQCGGGVSNKFIVSPKSRVDHPLDALIDGYDSVSVKTTALINQMPSTQLTPIMPNLQLDTSSYIG